jgi:Bifunctional DNA primase/polymerase, N-terminal/Primase C terminal 1 (PriCT-1)
MADQASGNGAILTEALLLYDRGLWVVPCNKEKKPVWKAWQKERRSREELADALSNGHRDSIGIVLTQALWIDVECDTEEAEANLRSLLGSTLATPTWKSKRGLHRLFRRPDGLPSKAVLKVDGIEFRIGNDGKGALSIVPPSVHPDGPVYTWLPGLSIHNLEPAELPAAVVERLRSPGKAKAADTGAEAGGDIPEPGRNDALFRLACHLWRSKLPKGSSVPAMVQAENIARCRPPLEAAEVAELVEKAKGQVEEDKASTYPYFVQDGCITHTRQTRDGAVSVPLCNFAAKIVEQVWHDDGAERRLTLALEGTLADSTPMPRVEVPASEFAAMHWPAQRWGTRAVVYAGQGAHDHLRAALQILSADVACRTVYTHTGWRQLAAGWWVYLHGGGAIGEDGTVDGVQVALDGSLARFVLPDPLEGEALKEAIWASLRILDVAPRRVTVSLLGEVYRAVLATADFSGALTGPTGVGKTEMATLAQQHFGRDFDARSLPGSWTSTANALETLCFRTKDALIVIDDFAPGGTTADVARMHRDAGRHFRAQGNNAGRGRCNPDGSLRPDHPPRGLTLSTGEDLPRGQSVRARLWASELGQGDVNWANLTAAQADAAAGLYAGAIAGFVKWLAPRIERVRRDLPADVARLRDELRTEGQHARTPGIAADLLYAWRLFLEFAVDAGTFDTEAAEALLAEVRGAILEAAARQKEHVEAAEPTGYFLRLIAGALASGRAHLAASDGAAPANPEGWGWRKEYTATGPTWRPQGRRIGWMDGKDEKDSLCNIYLQPEAAFAAAQELGEEQGEVLPVTPTTLWKRLRERGLLASWDQRRQRNTTRRTLEGGKQREVLHLLSTTLLRQEPSIPSFPSTDTKPGGGTG